MMVNSKINPNLFIIYSACLFFIIFRLFIFNEDLLSKTFGLTFLVGLFFLIDKKTVLLCLDKILIVFIFHLIFSQLLIFLDIGIYQIIYSSREVVDVFRSNKFFFPEASYLARVSALLGTAIYLNKDKLRKWKPKVIFLGLMCASTLSITGIILGSILIFLVLNNLQKFLYITAATVIFLLIYNGFLTLPGRLSLIQSIVNSGQIFQILNDSSFAYRIENFLFFIRESFTSFSFVGVETNSYTESLFGYFSFGFLGTAVIIFILLNLLVAILFGNILVALIGFLLIFFDTFTYPPFLIFIWCLANDNLGKIKSLMS